MKISVVMPVFNQARYLSKAIKSILNQTYENLEFLILDDCSTDKGLKIIKGFRDKRIKVFKNKKRHGLAKSLNFLIGRSRAKYIARMDADDISLKYRLERQVKFLEKNQLLVLVGSWAKIINRKGRIIGRFKHPCKYVEIRNSILGFNPFVHPSAMFKRKIFKELGGYDENLFYSQDYDLFLRFVAKYPCANIPQYLLKFRWDPDFEKQKQQHSLALKIRLKAIREYGYNFGEIIGLIKPLIFYLIPLSIKKFYWQRKFKR